MEISIETTDNFSTVFISGRIDATTCTELEKRLFEVIDGGGKQILADLAGVDYISSAGLRVLLAATKKVFGDGSFAVSRPVEEIAEIFEMTGFKNFLNIYDTIEAAREAMVG